MVNDATGHEQLHKLQSFAYTLPGIAVLGYMFYNTLMASRSSTEVTIWISQIALGVLVLALLLLWVGATMAELEMIEKHLGYTRSVKSEAYFVGLVLALTITALGIFYNNILIFSLIHAMLSFFTMWGNLG